MFSQIQYIESLRREKRILTVHNQQLVKSHQLQKKKAERLEKDIKKQNRVIKQKDKKITQLEEELEKAKVTITNYKQMLFKQHKHGSEDKEKAERTTSEEREETKQTKKTNGQKKGHKGYGRKKPEKIDQEISCFLLHCPDCGNTIARGTSTHSPTVTDIPHWKEMQAITTQYTIDYQWCNSCKKALTAVPFGVIPESRIGINLFLMILIWRYQLRLPFKKITEILFWQYGIHLSPGGLVGISKKARKYFGKRYDNLLLEIRGAPVKHADETTWGMDGLLYWCWIFLTENVVYYTIEETRGKGVPQRILTDAIGILVRDGYAAYQKLPLIQQACFAHVYRKARDSAQAKGASQETKALFTEIKQLYGLLAEDIKRPFEQTEREAFHAAYKKDLEKIAKRSYEHEDAKRVQTYIANLGDKLLTALLYENVPLTNNAAEQAARQIVIGRKISGGSRSKEGAKTHAVNMSIQQTILKQNLPLFQTLESYLLQELPKPSFQY